MPTADPSAHSIIAQLRRIADSFARRKPAELSAWLCSGVHLLRFPMSIPKPLADFLRLAHWARCDCHCSAVCARAHSLPPATQITRAASVVNATTFCGTRLRSVLDVRVSDKLKQVKVPVLYLRAARDRVIPRSSSEAGTCCCPSALIVEINGPHFLLMTKPAEWRDRRSDIYDRVRIQDLNPPVKPTCLILSPFL